MTTSTTTPDNTLANFGEIIRSFQDPISNTTSNWYRPKTDNNNSNTKNGLCMQCNSPRKNPHFHPFCGAICKGAWNAAHTDSWENNKKNLLAEFSKISKWQQ